MVRENSLPGLWRDQSEAALLYDFREDGSVLAAGGMNWICRCSVYEVGGKTMCCGCMMEWAGLQELVFELDGDRLVLRELSTRGCFGEFDRVP